jgi:hypothetical protein
MVNQGQRLAYDRFRARGLDMQRLHAARRLPDVATSGSGGESIDDRGDRPLTGEVVGPRGERESAYEGRAPSNAWYPGGGAFATRTWSYEARPNVPVLGIFLVALGAILLLDALAPGSVGLLVAAAGVALGGTFLYLRARGGFGLYPGLFLLALSLPNLLVGLGLVPDRDGYSTLLLGAGLLIVAAVRLRDRRGLGWQAWLGTVLAVLGGVQVAGVAPPGDAFWAVALIAAGAYVVFLGR